MRKQQILRSLPLVGLLISFLTLYANDLFGVHIAAVSDLNFLEKTSLFAAFAFAAFAAVESISTNDRASFENKRFQIEDARNELEKAYGILYSMLNKGATREEEDFWLGYDERKNINEILATYPFMFSSEINNLYQEKIQNFESVIETSTLNKGKIKINLDVYKELKALINKEYTEKVKNYHNLLGKQSKRKFLDFFKK